MFVLNEASSNIFTSCGVKVDTMHITVSVIFGSVALMYLAGAIAALLRDDGRSQR